MQALLLAVTRPFSARHGHRGHTGASQGPLLRGPMPAWQVQLLGHSHPAASTSRPARRARHSGLKARHPAAHRSGNAQPGTQLRLRHSNGSHTNLLKHAGACTCTRSRGRCQGRQQAGSVLSRGTGGTAPAGAPRPALAQQHAHTPPQAHSTTRLAAAHTSGSTPRRQQGFVPTAHRAWDAIIPGYNECPANFPWPLTISMYHEQRHAVLRLHTARASSPVHQWWALDYAALRQHQA
jgi:hypothetical protein